MLRGTAVILSSARHYCIDVAGDTVERNLTDLQTVRAVARLMRTEGPSRRITVWGHFGVYVEWVSYRKGVWRRVERPEGKVPSPRRLLERVHQHWHPKNGRLMDAPCLGKGEPMRPPAPRCSNPDCCRRAQRWRRGLPYCGTCMRQELQKAV